MNASTHNSSKPNETGLMPAENVSSLNTEIQPHIELLNQCYRAVKGSVEMLAVFAGPNLKSALCMIEDAELLLDAARQLHAAMTAMEGR